MKGESETKVNWKKAILSAVIGSVVWTLALTPYVIFAVGMTLEQYLSWLLMEFILVPPIAPLVFWVTEKALKRSGTT
jgi:hypothetical protein